MAKRWISVYMSVTRKPRSKKPGMSMTGWNFGKEEYVELHVLAKSIVLTVFECYANFTGMSPDELNRQIDLFKEQMETLRFVEGGE